MTQSISKYDDVIDSRDVIARIEALDERAEKDCPECEGSAEFEGQECDECGGAGTIPGDLDDDEKAELTALKSLAEQAEGYAADWEYGATLIRDSYFQRYAEELADDLGAVDKNASWPMTCIDWEWAARELQMDYTAVDFDGVTYWIR